MYHTDSHYVTCSEISYLEIFINYFKQISVLAKTKKRLAHNFHGDLRTRILSWHHRSAYQKQPLTSEIHEEAEEIILVISSM
jgi:hypothetical protein